MFTSTDQAQFPPLEDSVLPFRKGDIDYSTSEKNMSPPFGKGDYPLRKREGKGICDCELSNFYFIKIKRRFCAYLSAKEGFRAT